MEIESIVLISRGHVQVLKVVMLQFTIQLFTYKVAAIVCMQNAKIQTLKKGGAVVELPEVQQKKL